MENKTVEEYCRVIAKLDTGSGAKSVEMARIMGLSRNTVALTLKGLSSAGFVVMHRYGKARLSPKGLNVARKMNFRHRVLESFFYKKLRMSKEKVHEEANAIEHWASEEMINKLYQFMGRPKVDPHGKVIA